MYEFNCENNDEKHDKARNTNRIRDWTSIVTIYDISLKKSDQRDYKSEVGK
jgi:hypothetical protein